MTPGSLWMIVPDEDLLELTTDLATTTLEQLSLNPAAEVSLTSCPQDRQPSSLITAFYPTSFIKMILRHIKLKIGPRIKNSCSFVNRMISLTYSVKCQNYGL